MIEKDTLYIVGCSKTKIWDKEPDVIPYVEARHVYKGRGFLKALTQVEWPWIVLSGKYGFIEPDHPIGRYDIELGRSGSVSNETLKAQVLQRRFWQTFDNRYEVRLADFPHIVCLNCDRNYVKKVRASFTRNKIHLRSEK